jgi:hypothetical protein
MKSLIVLFLFFVCLFKENNDNRTKQAVWFHTSHTSPLGYIASLLTYPKRVKTLHKAALE